MQEYQQAAIDLIDAGTCPDREANDVCASKAGDGGVVSYYSEFEYNGSLIVVTSGIPDHEAENNTDTKNPNWRCELKNGAMINILTLLNCLIHFNR